MTTTPPPHVRREQRLARQLAARADAPTYTTVTIKMEEVQVGDYVEKIPAQRGVRGLICESTVTNVEADLTTWFVRGYGRSKVNVAAVVLTFANEAYANVPHDFQVTVRRSA